MSRPSRLRVAACQYPIERPASWEAYGEKVARLSAEAARGGAELLVFPEYAPVELTALSESRGLGLQLEDLQEFFPRYLSLHSGLARQHGVHLLAGTFPVRLADGSFRNRAYLLDPDGRTAFQEKLQMTRFERERWGVSGGDEVRVLETELGRFGVCTCYDSEFPLLARAQAEAGADVLLVPSCTDAITGSHRIRIACRARALENQCWVVEAPTVGSAPWSEALDENVGLAGIYGPPDEGLPETGILAEGALNVPGWVYADLDLELTAELRKTGQVLPYRDWPGQTAPALRGARVVAPEPGGQSPGVR